jgi:hypothetical protein
MIEEILTGVIANTGEHSHDKNWEEGRGKKVQHLIINR